MRNTKSPFTPQPTSLGFFFLIDIIHREYLPELARVRAQREATLQKQKDDSTARMMADLAVDRATNPTIGMQDRWNPQNEEEEEEEDDGGELNIIDRSACFQSIFRGYRWALPSVSIPPGDSPGGVLFYYI